MAMSSRVTKSLPFLVAPSEATPAGALRLTSMDSALVSLPMAALLVFKHPVDQLAEILRQALSRALVPYYPIAGRLSAGAHGLSIACTGEGVVFVGASATCTLRDARLSDSRPAIPVEDLTVTYAGQYNKEPPLLLMQVTKFSCGGFVVGVTWNHVVADGVGMAQFLQAVGEFARGFSSSSVEPVRVDNFLPELPAPIITMTKSMVSRKHTDFPSSYITIPMSFINRIKDEFRRSGQQRGDQKPAAPATCTAFDVFTAAIWRSRARATIAGAASQDAPTALAFTVNVRKQAGAKDGYYSNVFAFGLAAATLREVADGDILDLVRLIKDAKVRVPYTFTDGAAYIGDEMGGRLQGLDGYCTLYVTSWWNLGLDDVDFGGGGPARVMGNMERKVVPACILCGRKDKADGVAAMAFCVKQEHEEAFHAELRRLK
ncbi:hypothetical protein GQ55_7G063500 [Panicum hallii var. hallii]|uniref:Uncharacterized protein n=1 Tax=Panicum hallii var. hallii TaxID=1504633 RepID=A0A2T7CSL2_9POAL|nr:hypothetical protein GQ55_7G063500 [Panicum hallii var. hallii]